MPGTRWRPVDPQCICGAWRCDPGSPVSRVDEGGWLRTRQSTNRPEVRFRTLGIDGTLELRLAWIPRRGYDLRAVWWALSRNFAPRGF